MSNTLFNDAALNVKVNLSSGSVEHNALNTTNVITLTSSGGSGTTSNLADLLDVNDATLTNNAILQYNTATGKYDLNPLPTGAFKEYEFTAANGQTNFAGSDNSGSSLNYKEIDSLKVFLNGILLERGEDYTANNTANVVLTSAASNNDVLQVHVYSIFTTNNFSIAANNNIGVGNTNPRHDMSINGDLFLSGNVITQGEILDSNNRQLKIYNANGDIVWG